MFKNLINSINSENSYVENGFLYLKSYDSSYQKITSSMLSFMDFVGADSSFGILFVPKTETSSFSSSRIEIEITIKSYLINKEDKIIKIITNRSPII